ETRGMQIARIDLSTAEGQAAYQAFINSGQIPQWSPPGVQQSGTTEVFTHEYARFIGLQVGSFSLGGAGDSNGAYAVPRWVDCTVDIHETCASGGGVTCELRFQLDANGEPDYANATWTIVRAGVHPDLMASLSNAYDP